MDSSLETNSRLNLIKTVQSSGLLDPSNEEQFDRITRLAKKLFHLPIVLIAIADTNRIWFKSSIGMPYNEVSRDSTLGGHLLSNDGVFVIEDTLKDHRFANNSLVTAEPFVRFYASYQLKLYGGISIGSLCIMDTKPRSFNDHELEALVDLGHLIEDDMTNLSLTVFDDLTKLLNYQGFYILARNNYALSSRGDFESTLIYYRVDLDYSRSAELNDQLLCDFCDSLRDTLRTSDLIARLGTNIFVALLNNTSMDEAEETASQLSYLIKASNIKNKGGTILNYHYGLLKYNVNHHTDIQKLISEVIQLADNL